MFDQMFTDNGSSNLLSF